MWLLPQDELSIPLQVSALEFRSRLNAGLVPSKLRSLFQNGFVGEATDEHVHVRWARRFVSNDLAPQFRGAISPDGRFLRGTFRQRGWVLAVLLLSVLLALGAILLILQSADSDRRATFVMLAAIVVLAVLLPRLGWAMARSDLERITEVLRAAARGQSLKAGSR
jgi:hypothetical protein